MGMAQWAWRRGWNSERWNVWWVAYDGVSHRVATARDAHLLADPTPYARMRPIAAQLLAGALRDAQSDASVAKGTWLPGITPKHAREQQGWIAPDAAWPRDGGVAKEWVRA